jgi:hypothetical protein
VVSSEFRVARRARLEDVFGYQKIPNLQFSFCKRVPIETRGLSIQCFTSPLLCVITAVFAK